MNDMLRRVFRENLLLALERLKQHADPVVVAKANMAEMFFLELEAFDRVAAESRSYDPGVGLETNDDTNHEKFKLLLSFGFSANQLIDFARAEGLHNLRIVRMLRIVCGFSFDEAMDIVGPDLQVDS